MTSPGEKESAYYYQEYPGDPSILLRPLSLWSEENKVDNRLAKALMIVSNIKTFKRKITHLVPF